MLTLASTESLVGSIFFGGFLCALGWIARDLAPMDRIKAWLNGKPPVPPA